jgi:hypothetical protein
MNAVVVPRDNAVMSAAEIRAQVNRIQEVMAAVMKNHTHFGVIPGTQKPTLYKAGSEVLLTTFRIAVEPEVEDLSSHDEVRYRVRALGRHQTTGIVIGAGLGECSSNEEKYRWRKAVCDEEFDETPSDRRREKWFRGNPKPYKQKQVRTVPADVANTVLKMAKKRAQIDMTLTALAASDIFTQDVEDASEEMRETVTEAVPKSAPRSKSAGENATGGVATEAQRKLISSKLERARLPETELLKQFGIESLDQLPFDKVNDALAWLSEAPEK